DELEITSPANPRIKQLGALRRRRGRDQANVTVVEGQAEIRLALAAGVRPEAMYYCPDLNPAGADAVIAAAAEHGAQLIRVPRLVFEKISYREGPDGLLAVVPAIGASLDQLAVSASPLIVVCA